MKGYDLLKGMGHIDDSLVEEALTAEQSLREPVREPKRGFWERLAAWPARTRWVAAAACVAIAVFAGWGISQGGQKMTAPSTAPMEMAMDGELPESAKNAAESEMAYGGSEEAEDSLNVQVAAEPEEAPFYTASTLVESYESDQRDACYVVPEAGASNYSVPLRDAMAEYGETALYHVVVDIFEDGAEKPLEANDPEVAELLEDLQRGYGIETSLEPCPSLYATYEQLQNFPADEDHGWMLFLFDEE